METARELNVFSATPCVCMCVCTCTCGAHKRLIGGYYKKSNDFTSLKKICPAEEQNNGAVEEWRFKGRILFI